MSPQMKIVVKVSMHCDKCRTKALKIAAAAHGVSKVSIEGANKDHVAVIGDGVDSVCLMRSLRKKFGCSCTLVKVEVVKPADKTEKKPPPAPPPTPAPSPSCVQRCCATQFRPMYCELVHEYPEPTTCSIM
ncbi:heavy metal-associated isoprenylated plant protein 47-like isoform X2 [Pyrus x bretschneideri]|uniref:heavy metal-associated isoprenylated plant protein 47-like isoform X2 n=1 Tax=Pyrus x bretschneideri TaxID=225117 RepID=UPI00202EABEA|nr:heavy metal-associated isoprenylated plant protein 47-like isoform X2 [Pyrus x bretschneideri]XP_048425196.1 heavy metal-associated isoprenylated plant protein 47-like isoform X2 [Pyrus x bretschneideri]